MEAISEKCPEGSLITCTIWTKWDEELDSKFGQVKLRKNFWISYFCDHIKSAQHKQNCVLKACLLEGNQRQIKNIEAPKKRLIQSVIPFAAKNPTTLQIRDCIVGGVSTDMASGTTLSRYEEDVQIISFLKHKS